MRWVTIMVIAFVLAVLPSIASGGAVQADSIVVTELPDAFELTVPVSQLVVHIPKGGLSQVKKPPEGGSMASRRYFYLEDKGNQLIVSGWFEPQSEFPGIEKFWDAETAGWPGTGLPKPEVVSFKKIGKWDTVSYIIPVGSGSNPNIRAHWLQAGTWVDLHLSIHSELPRAVAAEKLVSLLTQIRITEKNP